MASLFPDDDATAPRSATSAVAGRAPFPRRARPKAAPAILPALQPGWVLAHCDGGARGNPGPAGFGAVLVDAAGSPLAALSEFLGFRTNNYAEYSGLLAVLNWALEHGHPRLRVISDSELMVKQIQGKYKVNSPDLRPLYEEARRRIGRLEGFEIHHALRHKNKEADQLANDAMDRGMGKTRASDGTEAGHSPGPPTATPRRAIPYPQPGSAPPAPGSFGGVLIDKPVPPHDGGPAMLRGFVRDGVVHPLGSAKLREGSFVKIIPE